MSKGKITSKELIAFQKELKIMSATLQYFAMLFLQFFCPFYIEGIFSLLTKVLDFELPCPGIVLKNNFLPFTMLPCYLVPL